MREEFEKLPEIAEILKNKTIKFVERTNKYYSYHYSVEYLNGAWYAYQEQHKIINMQECGATEIQMIIDDNEYDDATKLERIKELLK